MSDFVPMWKQAADGDVEALTRALDEEGRDPAAEAERKPGVCGLKGLMYLIRDVICLLQTNGTALHWAASMGHLPLVKFLFERAPQLVEMRTNVSVAWCVLSCSLTLFLYQDGCTALHKAALNGHLLVVEFLFKRAPQLIEMRTNVSAAW
jgi:ankyrin repeat protein